MRAVDQRPDAGIGLGAGLCIGPNKSAGGPSELRFAPLGVIHRLIM